jgi:O-antigen ligase
MPTMNEPDRPSPTAGETAREGGALGRVRRVSTRSPALPPPADERRLCRPSVFALVGTCAYVAGFALPLRWDLPLLVLALMGALAFASDARRSSSLWSPLTISVLVFLASVAVSTLVSAEIGRSVRLSAALLPGTLLFFLVADHFEGIRHTRLLYLTFSLVALGLASVLLWTVWREGWRAPRTWVSHAGSPLLLVPNDVTFLAVVAPLSWALLVRAPRSAAGLLAALSLLLSVGVMGLLLSGVALLTMLTALMCAAALVRPRLGVACGLGVLILALLVDGCLGFPLVAKFGHMWAAESGYLWAGESSRLWEAESMRIWYGRLPIWGAAWARFLQAPVWGHGPHTFVYRAADATSMAWPHNLYLELLAEQGLIGLAALGLLLVAGVSAAWHTLRVARGEARILGAGAFAGLVSFCVAACLELSLLRQWVVIFLFVLLGVIAQLSSSHAPAKEGAS